jgi:hypothetical protein
MMPDTNDAIAQRRRLAQALMGQGTSTEPVGHWTQAAARVAQALSGSANMGYADSASKARETYDTQQADAKQGANRAYAEGAMQREVQQKMPSLHKRRDCSRVHRSSSSTFMGSSLRTRMRIWTADSRKLRSKRLQQKAGQDDTRLRQLQALNIDPESAEGIAFLANGKLPAPVIEKSIARRAQGRNRAQHRSGPSEPQQDGGSVRRPVV